MIFPWDDASWVRRSSEDSLVVPHSMAWESYSCSMRPGPDDSTSGSDVGGVEPVVVVGAGSLVVEARCVQVCQGGLEQALKPPRKPYLCLNDDVQTCLLGFLHPLDLLVLLLRQVRQAKVCCY